MKLLSSCLPTVQYNQTWSCDYFPVLLEKINLFDFQNPGFCSSSLWNSGSTQVFRKLLGQTKDFMPSKVNLIKVSMAKKYLLIWWGRNPSWGWEEGAFFRGWLHTYKVNQGHAALAHSYFDRMLMQKTYIHLKILVILSLSVCFLLCPKKLDVWLYFQNSSPSSWLILRSSLQSSTKLS